MNVVREEEAKAQVLLYNNVVVVVAKPGCEVCEYFIPEVLDPLFKEEFWVKNIHFLVIENNTFFPHKIAPMVFCYKNGKLVHTSDGAAPKEKVKKLINDVYFDAIEVPTRREMLDKGIHPFR